MEIKYATIIPRMLPEHAAVHWYHMTIIASDLGLLATSLSVVGGSLRLEKNDPRDYYRVLFYAVCDFRVSDT